MKIVSIGGGPGGLYTAILLKLQDPGRDITVIERNGPEDTFGWGVVFSDETLGFFADPILNTIIDRGDASIAELIFHELAHRRLYRKGQSAFNESFANAVAQEGVRRWLRSKGNEKGISTYENRLKRRAELLEEIGNTRARLKKLYASALSEPITRAAKERRA